MLELTTPVDRCACCVDSRAMRRKAIAIKAKIGVIEIATKARVTFRVKSRTVMISTSRIWLSRFIVSVTTFEKSSESEVTRLTIRPEGLVSKNDRSRSITAEKASWRSLSTTSPTTRAVSQDRMKLNTHAKTPAPSKPKNRIQIALFAPSLMILSIPQLPRTGWTMLAAELSTIITATSAIAPRAGLK